MMDSLRRAQIDEVALITENVKGSDMGGGN